jgi:hypothetical protein
VDPGPLALSYLQDGQSATMRSSLMAIRFATDRTAYVPIVERFIRASAPAVRLAAVETGLLWALPAAQVACGQMAAAHEPNAMLLSALLGRPGFEKPIYEALVPPVIISARFGPSMHPALLRCSSVAYVEYAPSPRLAWRAPERPKPGRSSDWRH